MMLDFSTIYTDLTSFNASEVINDIVKNMNVLKSTLAKAMIKQHA